MSSIIEHAGMLRREIVGREALGREVPQVPSHDRVHTGFNRGGRHMDVVRVGQIETSGTCRVSCHNRIGKVPVHDRAGSFQHVHREIGPVRENATYPLRMDVHAPSRCMEVLVGQSQEKIPKAGRIEDVGVKQRRGKGHRLLQAEFLIHGSQFVQRLAATGFGLAAVVKDVLGTDAATCAYLPAGDPSFVEQLNQVRFLKRIAAILRSSDARSARWPTRAAGRFPRPRREYRPTECLRQRRRRQSVPVLPVSTQKPRIAREQQVHVPSTAAGPGPVRWSTEVGVRLNPRF